MTDASLIPSDRASALRVAFDGGFAIAPAIDATVKLDLLAIRVGSEVCALRLSEITGLFADKTIAPLPGGHAALLGIAGFRGAILPVFGLGALLGYATRPKPRWMVIAAGAAVALAFDAFDGHLRVPTDAIAEHDGRTHMRSHVREVVRAPDGIRPVVQLASILQFIGSSK